MLGIGPALLHPSTLPDFVVVLSGTFPRTSFVSLAILRLGFLIFNVLVSDGKILHEAVVLLLKSSHAKVRDIVPPCCLRTVPTNTEVFLCGL